ncbi:MAG: 23S rRNA (uracil(1939)-C(5))-methyltransferase RlmD [Coriobacteriales bacterium]|nr:23S rRNA (uracil(1939)-C(5))-methyltransferase RlmD [Coriobacteriales bacterium]
METQRLRIERLSYSADSIAHLENGKVCFVAGGCPGDLVEAHINQEKKGFAKATVTQVLDPGEARVKSPCPYAGVCGGCPWQHVDYDAQLAAKRANLLDALMRIGGFDAGIEQLVDDTLPSPKRWGYRNKVELEVKANIGGKLALGMHGVDGGFAPVKSCLLLDRKLQKTPDSLRGALAYALSGDAGADVLRVGIRYSLATGSQELALWTRTGAFPRGIVSQVVGTAVPGCSSVVRVMLKEDSKTKAREVSKVEVLHGKGFWKESLQGNEYLISAPSFFQVNSQQAAALIRIVMGAFENVSHGTAFDMYSGAGTFTLPLAQDFDEVVAVESYGSSVRDLRRNLDNANLYAQVIGGDVARELPGMGYADVAVIDPPRAGLAPEVIDSLCDSGVQRLVYVSCDPSTLARDLALLCRDIFRIERLVPVDLFPQTYHCETVTLLTRNKVGSIGRR